MTFIVRAADPVAFDLLMAGWTVHRAVYSGSVLYYYLQRRE